MIHRVPLALGALAIAGAAYAEPVMPQAVVFENGAVAQSLTGATGDPEQGAAAMSSRGIGNCVACHQVAALSAAQFQGEIGPPLDGVGDRWNEAELRGIVADAKMTFDGSMMPSFYKDSGYIRPGDAYTGKAATELLPLLTPEQVEDVVAFLLTLKE